MLPLILLSGQIVKDEILAGRYASSTTANESSSQIQDFTRSTSSNTLKNDEFKNDSETSESTGTTKSNSSLNENYEKKRFGYDLRKSKSELLAEYRKNIYNVYEKIVEDLNPLFFALF